MSATEHRAVDPPIRKRLPPRRRQRYVEMACVVLLSMAGMATSWSSYQAARWSGVQSTAYSRAGGLRVESTRASARANQQRAIDAAVFMSWVNAYVAHDDRLTAFYETRFRDEFKPAFKAWMASKPLVNAAADDTPFALENYRLHNDAVASRLEAEAAAVFQQGQEANRRSDAYVLNAVLLATVLFLAGIAQQFRVLRLQMTLLSVASALLVIGLTKLVLMPKVF